VLGLTARVSHREHGEGLGVEYDQRFVGVNVLAGDQSAIVTAPATRVSA
jgi:hypothetical protein